MSYYYIIDLFLSNEFNALLVFIDRFTKMIHLIPCNKIIDASLFIYIFLNYIIQLYDISNSCVSNRDSIFISHFWKYLIKFIDIEDQLSTFFHSQMNDQIKRMNQIIKQYFHIYYNYQ